MIRAHDVLTELGHVPADDDPAAARPAPGRAGPGVGDAVWAESETDIGEVAHRLARGTPWIGQHPRAEVQEAAGQLADAVRSTVEHREADRCLPGLLAQQRGRRPHGRDSDL